MDWIGYNAFSKGGGGGWEKLGEFGGGKENRVQYLQQRGGGKRELGYGEVPPVGRDPKSPLYW